MFARLARSSYFTLARNFSSQVHRSPGASQKVNDTRQVQLRGTFLKGNFEDLPTLIFFPTLCDSASSWTPFFVDPDNKILNYRNVWLVDPRNFGNSDHHPSFDLGDMADDVLRFMYQNKISTATLGGHGFGAKLATAVGCYYPERVTGVIGVDGGPIDQRYHEAYREWAGYLERLNEINLRSSKGEIEGALRTSISDPKWRAIFASGLRKGADGFAWNFNLEYLLKNVKFNKADAVGNWTTKHGLWVGRSMFIFPEYSRWIHLNTNTLALHKICLHLDGYGQDIFAIQGDENPLNHWMYEIEDYTFPLSRKITTFLSRYDGVHLLLKDRSEIGNYFIPDIPNSRSNPEHIYRDYSPAHLHHNWRFSNIYEEAARIDKEKAEIANASTEGSTGTGSADLSKRK